MNHPDPPIGQIIRSARQQLRMSQYALADELAAVSGKPTMGRDRVARWERGRQVPRREWRRWLSVVLHVPPERLDAGAVAARRQNRVGPATVTVARDDARPARRPQGTPALLPVFRSRVQAGILAATLLNPNRAFSLTELADHAGGSLASVSKESKLLEEAGILVTRSEGAIRLIRAATDKPTLAPLTQLIRLTFGVPQVIGEEFGRVPGVAAIAVTGTWAERFAGVTGPEPECIQVRLTPSTVAVPDHDTLRTAARRAGSRLRRAVRFAVVARRAPSDALPGPAIPRQRQRGGAGPVVHIAPPAPSSPLVPPSPDGARRAAVSWPTGAATVSKLLDDGRLELFSGAAADSTPYLDLAAHHLAAAEDVEGRSAGSAFVLVCQAAQLIGAGLLAEQGLRPAAGTGGDAVSSAVVAQFGPQFGHLELLRQRQRALSDPTGRDNRVTMGDVEASVSAVRSLLATAREVTHELTLFAPRG